MKVRLQPSLALIAALAAVLAVRPARAEFLPLWEAGLGVGVLNLPHYRGADLRKTWVLPVPYLVYRGRIFKADRSGVRASLFESDRVRLNLSLNGTLPVSGGDNPLREGMPDLRPTVEFGPTLDLNLWHSQAQDASLDLRAPLRTAITVESSPRDIGWLFAPNLALGIADPAGLPGWKLALQAGPLFSSRRYNEYFYSVDPDQARAWRPAYEASGGYSGAQFTATLSRRFRHYWVGGFLRYDSLSGAVFRDSPLVRQRSALSAGIGFAWIFGTSRTRVQADE